MWTLLNKSFVVIIVFLGLLFGCSSYSQAQTRISFIIAEEVDTDPSDAIYKVVFPNGTISISEGIATYTAVAPGSITVSDDESTDDNQEVVFTTDNLNLESDGDFYYNPSSGTVTATEFNGGGSSLTGVLKNIVEDTTPQLGGNLAATYSSGGIQIVAP